MITSAVVAYLHYLCLGVIFASLSTELFALKSEITAKLGWRIILADSAYGLAGIMVLATGILRVLYFGKETSYYLVQPFFWIKILLFALVGILSLYPTFTFLSWIKFLRFDKAPDLDAKKQELLQTIVTTELVGFSLIPLTASLMARGIGYEWGMSLVNSWL